MVVYVSGHETDRPSLRRRAQQFVRDRPVLSVFLVALAARLVVAVGIAIVENGGVLQPDGVSYSRLAEEAANGKSSAWSDYDDYLYTRTGALLWPITGLFRILGPVDLAGQVFVAIVGAVTAAATVRLGLEFLPRGYAVLAGMIVALLPSQVLWSSLINKDALVWAMLSVLAVVVVQAPRGSYRRLLLGLLASVLLLLGLAYTRLQTLEIALVALVLASLFAPSRRRVVQVAAAAGIATLIPLALGMGPAGATFVANSGSLEQRRENNAVNAASAVVAVQPPPTTPSAAVPPPTTTETPARTTPTKAPAARVPPAPPVPPPAPPVPPPAPPVPPPAPPAPPPPVLEDGGLTASASYVPKGLVVVVLRPFPWEAATAPSSTLKLAALESLLWYPILLCAAVGLFAARRHVRVLAFPLLVLGATAVMYALTEGNLGTAYRHRGEFVWVMALLAALGLSQAAAWSARRRGSTAVLPAELQ